jgi:hypothetical protein
VNGVPRRARTEPESDIAIRVLTPVGFLGVALTSCMATLPPSSFQGAGPRMRPESFFTGATTSSGVLENDAGAPTRRFHVEGAGRRLANGDFRLDQTVAFERKAPSTRTWIIRRLDEHRYTASLTDASGPVTAEASGNLFHLRYAMKSPPAGEMEQWMYLQPDGRTIVNEAKVRSFGIVVGHLSERITSVDATAPSP